MKTLLSNVKIIDSTSIFHLQRVNILIENKVIIAINDNIDNIIVDTDTEIIDCQAFSLSAGWVDMCAYSGEPGTEHKETLQSLCKAANLGGFTDVLIQPNTNPIIQTKEIVKFIANAPSNFTTTSLDKQVNLLPIAALSINNLGEEMTDFLDLHHAGAVAFSDGQIPLTNTAMLSKCLLYLQHINGLLINKPDDKYLTKYGLMHEGEVSTSLGLKGIPSIAEHLGIERDLKILEYTGGKIHFSNISTAESVELIRKAKAKGLQVSCDIAAYQLSFLDEDLFDFDTNLKVKPPFRTEIDKQALLQGLADDTIDCVVSAHLPCDEEGKFLEFDMADFGILGLQTAFASIRIATENVLTIEKLIEKFTINPRKILQLAPTKIAIGEQAKLTLFDENAEFILTKKDIVSPSKNTPFINKTLKGKVIRTF